jgi:hypothetical protein
MRSTRGTLNPFDPPPLVPEVGSAPLMPLKARPLPPLPPGRPIRIPEPDVEPRA